MDCDLAEREAARERQEEGLSFHGSFFSHAKSKLSKLIIMWQDYLNGLSVNMVVSLPESGRFMYFNIKLPEQNVLYGHFSLDDH